MLDMKAKQFFEENSGSPDKVKKLQEQPERYDWELSSSSCFSPGPVSNSELLYRQAPSPLFYDDETGKLKPTAFDEVFNRGCSVDRGSHSSIDDIYRRGAQRVEKFNTDNPDKPRRSFSAVAELTCAEIRAHTVDGAQAVGVYDTALETNVSHAELCQIIADTKANKRSVRTHLFEIARTSSISF